MDLSGFATILLAGGGGAGAAALDTQFADKTIGPATYGQAAAALVGIGAIVLGRKRLGGFAAHAVDIAAGAVGYEAGKAVGTRMSLPATGNVAGRKKAPPQLTEAHVGQADILRNLRAISAKRQAAQVQKAA